MMKESKSSTSKMINKNWVLKRKRRKLPFGQDRSIGKEQPRGKQNSVTSESSRNATAKRLLKTEAATDQISSKKKGNDGYYYECVICDLGGNLLCCDSCPCTYHLQCLSPPLKRIPMEKWQCPSYSQGNDTLREINHLDSISKRARTKIVTEKSKGGVKPLNMDKVSQIFGSTFISKKRSSSKGKSISMLGDKYLGKKPLSSLVDATCSSKPTDPTLGISMEGTSTCADADEEKTKEVLFPSKTELEKNNEQLEVSPDLSDNKMPSRKPLVLAIAADGEEMRKRKLKVNDSTSQKKRTVNDSTSQKKRTVNDSTSQKKRKTEKGKITVSTSIKCKSQYDKVHKKKKPVTHSISASLSKEDAGTKKSDVLQENEVDRVLGCRIQGESTNSSRPLSVIVMDDSPCADLLISENQSRLPESNSACNNDVDVKTTENLTDGYQNVVKSSDKEESLENINSVERVRVYRRSMSKDNIKGNPTDSLSKSTDDSCSPAMDGKDQDDSSVTAEHLDRTNDKMETQEDMNVTLRSEDNNEFPKTCVRPVSPETKLKEVDVETGMSSTIDNNVQNTNVVESSCLNAEKVLYEFLVKWVGKSNIHNSWISESKLKVLAKRKLENYKAKYGMTVINICEEQWKQPQRVLALRTSKDGTSEAFVKWTGLPYDECTWESLVEPVLRNSPHLINLFDKFETLTLERDASQGSSTKKINDNQTDFVNLIEQPKELKGGSLFPHQLEALNWLRKCWYKSKNVILADEMGLGKTISACAFISSLYFEFKVALPSLVLVPLSTMPNWLAEFALWAPDLNVVEYHGCAKARAINRQYEWHASDPSGLNKKTTAYKFNVLLTTYEMVLADSSHLHGVPWEVLVVDEGHRLKNSGSKLFSLLNTFSFQHRVLLTGTPLQNNIGEMYNLLNFLQPASFPSLSSFEEKFNDLTTAEKVDELKKLVAPHMLRRLKKDAMKNIPPKIERMVPVELSSIQAEYYRAMLTKNYQILRNIGKGVAQQSMLNIVMQLRKVCNHPYLIPGTEPDSGSVEFLHEMRIKASAKLTLLHSMLKVLHKEGHRVLIFSQMTKLLDILEDYLTIEFGPKTYERVDGSVCVADRQAAIARFNQDTSRFVFLLSTRACGLGINLATADTVIIYDSDFNPHADIQAMNRAHRIGQSNRLLVYRLVVRASVEERILQLAKKKLMLDQLFVNKSESQKEVEDILKWGTEELFNDSPGLNRKDIGENNSNKDDTVADIEHKHRKRSGSLGDVYKDKCTDSSSKIVWDENAISKLLDRSNLQHGSTDVTEGDPENDMLGSVKSLEWNDEPTEEQGVDVSPTHGTNDICAQNSERKEDNAVTGTEENEWDRLLRVRWEKYQSEEEAALGRGKRQRKAVTYREAYAPHRSETMSECGGEEEKAPEPEPEREYTAAGRALKAKFVKLRARQKKRLAQRNAVGGFLPAQGLLRPESLSHSPANAKGEDMAAGPMNPAQEGTSINSEDNKMSRFSKHRKSSHHDVSVSNIGSSLPDVFLPNHHNKDLNTTNSIPTSSSLPILGLCAPNANQIESSESNPLKTSRRRSRQGMRQGFPFSLPSCSGFSMETEVRSREAAAEIFQQSFKDSIPDHNLPFVLFPPAVQGKVFDAFENALVTISAFQEKTLPNLPFDERLMARFPLSTKNMPSSHLDLLPNLSLGGRLEALNRSMQDLPTIPSLPNFKMPPSEDLFRFNQQHRDVSPSFDLGQRLNTLPSFPENQRKVLENILMRTGSTSSNLFRKKPKLDGWSEDELDSLWVGVRRHGRGNWDVILRDPKLKFSKYKMPEDLSVRWEEEQLKVFQGTEMTKSTKSALFPISDGMMERALHGSRFILPPKFKTHLTDMKLGIGDPPSDRPSCQNDHFRPPQSWSYDKYRSTFPECASAEASDRSGTSSNAPTERPFLLNSFGASFLGSFGLNHSSSTDMHDSCIDLRNGDCISRVLSVPTKGPDLLHSKGKDIVACSTSEDKLPHWLREAVSSPAKLPDPDLPPTISAISQSIRLLHGDDKPTIPPFVVPGPPPSLPKDPRHSLKKIKKRRSHNRILTDVAGSTKNIHMNLDVDYGASSSGISGFQQIESDPKLNSLKLEVINPSHSSSMHQPKNTSTELPPSPEVLQLGESCVAPDPHFLSISSTSSFLESKLPMTKPVDQANFNVDCEGSFGNKVQHSDSGYSSKTQSDPSRVERHHEAEISSEGTVSDHAERDQET